MKEKIKSFIKEHKIEITMGALLVAGGVGYILFKNRKAQPVVNKYNVTLPFQTLDVETKDVIIGQMIDTTKENVQKTIDKNVCREVGVSAHLRNLPKGQTHTLQNELNAKLAGIEFLPINQSYIHDYKRCAQS